MGFLSQKELNVLNELSILRDGWYTNSNGNKSRGKLWLSGVNDCTLTGCELKQTRFGNNYVAVEFRRAPQWIDGIKTKVSFIPHYEYYFDDNGLKELCAACGHVLKERPATMTVSDYLSHVSNRANTFIGTKLKASVSLYKEAAKDEYGEVKAKNLVEDLVFYKMKVEYFNVKEHIKIDYEKLAQVIFNS